VKPKTVTGETVWIVDYDLPANNARRNFYRHIKAWLRDRGKGKTAEWSTFSVVITQDKEFAEYVFYEASQLGHASLYKAEKLAEGGKPRPENLAQITYV
jgi:hypothetical protein